MRPVASYALVVLVPMLSHWDVFRYVNNAHCDGSSSLTVAGKNVDLSWKSIPFVHSFSNINLTELPLVGLPISDKGIAISYLGPLVPAPFTADIFVSDVLTTHAVPLPINVASVPFSYSL